MASTGFISYYRVSTVRQGASGLGLEAQREAVHRYLNGRHAILAEFTEIESGRKAVRPELKKALAAARLHRAPLIVAKLDRLSRNVAFLCALRDSSVKIVFADMPDANELSITVMAAVAEHEAKAISDRTRAALAAAKARGTRLGGVRPRHRPLDDDARRRAKRAVANRVQVRSEELAPVLKELDAAGITSLRAIARELTARRIPAARGGEQWSATQAKRAVAGVSKMDLAD